MLICGIDPGAKGAAALVKYEDGKLVIERVIEVPKSSDPLSFQPFADKIFEGGIDHPHEIYFEWVDVRPTDTPKTAWELSKNVTLIESALYYKHNSLCSFVKPQKWQNYCFGKLSLELGLGETITSNTKEAAMDFLSALMNAGILTIETVMANEADAICIAIYGIYQNVGTDETIQMLKGMKSHEEADEDARAAAQSDFMDFMKDMY